MCKSVTREVEGLAVAIEQERMTPVQAARKLLKLYGINDERDLLVERKSLELVGPLEPFLNDHYDDRKQRIVINDEWEMHHFKALAAWLAAPVIEARAKQTPRPSRRRTETHPHRGREKHLNYVAAHS